MTERNLAASVRQRLLMRAKRLGEDYQLLLSRFAGERLLFRLSQSPFRDLFVLKGATLFTIWSKEPHRATRDIDLLGFGEFTEEQLAEVFRELARAPGTDGLTLDPGSVSVSTIREGLRYGGLRITLLSKLGTARIPLQVDVGFGTPRNYWTLEQTLSRVTAFAEQPVRAAAAAGPFPQIWAPQGPWH